ncbi:MAG: 30S ribosomal protein S18 [Spirochaetota bacterium]
MADEIVSENPAPEAPPASPPPSDGGGGRERRKDDDRKRFFKRKVCHFCKSKVDEVDYKDGKFLRRFTKEGGKILPHRLSGNCAKHQRLVSLAIKRARIMALLPYKARV